jgi:hypothetical protein
MLLLRFILILVLVYYLLKLLFRWLVGSSGRRKDGRWRTETSEKKQRYSDLTDQKIEDAEYEELS